MNLFEEKIEELGVFLGSPLHAERESICSLNVEGFFQIQLEYDKPNSRFLIATFICNVPPGAFRVDVLKATLKANYPLEALGTFAFSKKMGSLALFLYVQDEIQTTELHRVLLSLIHKAQSWKQGIDSGYLQSLPI